MRQKDMHRRVHCWKIKHRLAIGDNPAGTAQTEDSAVRGANSSMKNRYQSSHVEQEILENEASVRSAAFKKETKMLDR